MECLCPPPHPPLAFETLHPVYFPELSFLLSDSPQFLPLFPFFTACPRPVSPLPFPPPPPPQWSVREGFTWKWHIWLATSVCVTQHLTPLCRFSGGAQLPFSSFFFLFFLLWQRPPLPSNTTRFCIPVLNEKKKRQRGRQTDRWRDWEGGFRKERHGQWTLV